LPVLSFLHRGGLTSEERVNLQEYLRAVRPMVELLDREYAGWLEVAADNPNRLSRERDPGGQHAAVYLWRVGDTARQFVQQQPAKGANHYHEAMSLCLEARGAAAGLFKEASGTAHHNKPGAKVSAANRKLVESERLLVRARTEEHNLQTRLG
jgi:hypothetical protein